MATMRSLWRTFGELGVVTLTAIYGAVGGAIGLVVMAVTGRWSLLPWGIVASVIIALLQDRHRLTTRLGKYENATERARIAIEKFTGLADLIDLAKNYENDPEGIRQGVGLGTSQPPPRRRTALRNRSRAR
jgi:hypothetical protein